MLAKNCTRQDLYKALEVINQKYDGNVAFNREPEPTGRKFRFTLRVNSSHGKGSRLGQQVNPTTGNRRHLTAACWHVHGDFFDALFDAVPDAIIQAGDKTITKYTGNWEDRNIGSMMYPLYYSEACECN